MAGINSALAKRIAQLCLTDGEEADVHFRVGGKTGKRFPAHRLLLSGVSPVFRAMFLSADEWIVLDSGKDIQVADVDAESFEKLLVYIYKGTVGLDAISIGQMLGLHSAARKYKVGKLATDCAAKIVARIRPANALLVLDHCHHHSRTSAKNDTTTETELFTFKERALAVISTNSRRVLASDAFLRDAADASVAAVLRLDTVSVGEADIFQAIYKRAKLSCEAKASSCEEEEVEKVSPAKIRAAMGPLIELIRFPTMSAQEFNSVVVTTGVLSAKEVAEVKAKMPRARSQEEMTKTEMFVNYFLLAIALFLLFALLFTFIDQRKK